ncbi:MAG: sigma-70 family RNA polymerase sigma factor [Bacteroidales bacterium]|nr:sigma-70 family RNA polymerase sigma factor [Bacteroidales bacterium]MBS3776620.1 sigma-70 family RNA polymerase sigma factor [Bacteroidales bacterium]
MQTDKQQALYKNIHQDVIDRCRKGEQKAQFQIYKLYYKAMFNTSFRIVNDRMEAEDIMQEAFLKAFDKIHTYSGKVSFGAWLKRIVINHSLDELKKKKIELDSLEDSVYNPEEEEKAEEEEEETEIWNKVEEIREAINGLPDGYRIVLSLYLLEGFDHEEIAEILNMTSSTSRSQYTRAKNKLREELAKNRNKK